MAREPTHDATMVEMCEYWENVWKSRILPDQTSGDTSPEGIAAYQAREYQRATAAATLALWTARRTYEQAMASGKREQNGRGT